MNALAPSSSPHTSDTYTFNEEGQDDPAARLYVERRDALSNSRWKTHFTGLNDSQAIAMHEKLEELQRVRPLSGYALVGRIRGVKSSIMFKRVGNSRWGRSMLSSHGKNSKAYWARLIRECKDGQLT